MAQKTPEQRETDIAKRAAKAERVRIKARLKALSRQIANGSATTSEKDYAMTIVAVISNEIDSED